MSKLFSLAGRVALITGGSRGLGYGMACGLSDAGATVVLNGRVPATLEARRKEIEARGGKAAVASFDVCDRKASEAAIDEIERRHGRLDILINNAAWGVPHDLFETTDDEWRSVLDVALDSCFRLSRHAAKGMVKRGWGRIVNTSSINTRISRGTNTAYVAAKTGLEGLTRGLAVELATRGVTVNAIAPGYMETEINDDFKADPPRYEWIRNRVAMKRWGGPDEIAGAAVFLSSDASAYVTGHTLVVDGGMSIVI